MKDPGGLALHMPSSVDLPVLWEKKTKRDEEGKYIGAAILRLGKLEFKHVHTLRNPLPARFSFDINNAERSRKDAYNSRKL